MGRKFSALAGRWGGAGGGGPPGATTIVLVRPNGAFVPTILLAKGLTVVLPMLLRPYWGTKAPADIQRMLVPTATDDVVAVAGGLRVAEAVLILVAIVGALEADVVVQHVVVRSLAGGFVAATCKSSVIFY